MHLEQDPADILDEIQEIVLDQQAEFNRIWEEVRLETGNKQNFPAQRERAQPEQQEVRHDNISNRKCGPISFR